MASIDANKMRLKLQRTVMNDRIAAIYIYGSAVNGKLRYESDIDIALLPSYSLGALEVLELISQVEGIMSPLLRDMGFDRGISILDMRGKYTSIQLQYKVITEGILIYEGDKLQRNEYENSIKREYFDFEPFLKNLRERKYGYIPQKA